jgi:hypothetical protein
MLYVGYLDPTLGELRVAGRDKRAVWKELEWGCAPRACTYRERERKRANERERELSSEAVHRESAHTERERGREREFVYAALNYWCVRP